MKSLRILGAVLSGALTSLSIAPVVFAPVSRSIAVADEPQATGPLASSIPRPSSASSPSDTLGGEELPTGKSITPTAAQGAIFEDLDPEHPEAPNVRAGGASALAVSPDGTLMAILTSGYNSFFDLNGKSSPELSTDYLFLFDIREPRPKQIQVLPIRATFQGLTWGNSSSQLFASGGVDDTVLEFVREGTKFAEGRQFRLGHKSWRGPGFDAWGAGGRKGLVSGLALSPDGTRLLVANLANDSVSIIDIVSGKVVVEQDLLPGIIDSRRHGQPGGSYPRAVVWSSPIRAYVASERDREVISLELKNNKVGVVHRVPVYGQPVALLANRSGSRLYVAVDTNNRVVVIDTARDKVIESLDVAAPASLYANARMFGGANTNALVLTPDERVLLASDGGENAAAVIRLSMRARDPGVIRRNTEDDDADGDGDRESDRDRSEVIGMVPTGWYPTGVATSKNGASWYVVNGKSPTGPNASWCRRIDPVLKTCIAEKLDAVAKARGTPIAFHDELIMENQHIEQLEKAGFLTMPAPTALELARLTRQVARNNRFDRPDKTEADARLFSFLHDHIKHIIYILKENRSYDQVLGDLEVGNGDPRLAIFPEKITPNHHAIARSFVTLDNLLGSAEGSMQGWAWTESAQTTDFNERMEPLSYVDRGLSDSYGYNRDINMGFATSRERHADFPLSPTDPDILPGAHDVNAPDGPDRQEGKGYLWDIALQHGLTIRNWGLAPDAREDMLSENGGLGPIAPHVRDANAEKTRVFWTAKASLMPYSDPYYRAFFPAYADFWRVKEWKREFAQFCTAKSAPNLMLMWLGGDHTGAFDIALDGVNTPETQVADNDYALGLVIEAVAHSPFANDTLIIAIEDEAWSGGDHVDAHRIVTLFAGPYVRRHAVVSTRYTTVSVVKTIEEILGTGPIGLNDALAAPMSDVFDTGQVDWSYTAAVPDVLRSTQLPLPQDEHAHIEYPAHSAAWWAKAMAGQDFSRADRVDPVKFNRTLSHGLKPAP